jgi:hypothetical protein
VDPREFEPREGRANRRHRSVLQRRRRKILIWIAVLVIGLALIVSVMVIDTLLLSR